MLRTLHVRNYVLIDSLDIDFPEGLVIITGQTGAGKSIILGALSMVLGAKADASVIGGDSSGSCVIEAEFGMDPDDADLKRIFDENDAEWEGGDILIRRVINKTGRSRAFLNDCPISLPVLSSLAPHLLDIHSQHQTMMLSDRKFQLSVLDRFAGNAALLAEYRREWDRYGNLKSEIKTLSSNIARASAEKDYNDAQLRHLTEARLREGELEELEAEQKMLANAEEIKGHLCAVEGMFSGETPEGESVSLTSALREMQRSLDKIAAFMPQTQGLSSRIESCRLELEDIYSEISIMNSSAEASPERLAEVDGRISLLYGLMQKHSCKDVSELIALRESLSSLASDADSMKEKLEEMEKEASDSAKRLESLAADLHKSRVEAAPGLSSAIQENLRFQELPYSVFLVDVADAAMSSSGSDSVLFRFSSTGKNPVDVSKCASGGELSRIMLSLKSVMSRFFNMPTMVFDEIDTGVSGSVADRMGTMICEMGHYMQVFAITHLPQVAAKGNAHYLVSKTVDPETSKAVTTIKKLSAEQRVMELARMLSGSVLTDAAIANAKDLLNA